MRIHISGVLLVPFAKKKIKLSTHLHTSSALRKRGAVAMENIFQIDNVFDVDAAAVFGTDATFTAVLEYVCAMW